MARKAQEPERIEPSEDLYVPVGIEEIPREGALPKPPKEKAGLKTSAGAADLDFVKGGARRTLDGIRNFEWASLFVSLSNTIALGSIGVLAGIHAYNPGVISGVLGLVGWALGATAFGLFVPGVIFAAFGVRASHIGRSELGILQRREVEKSEKYLWRGLYTLIPGAGLALVLAVQESTLYKEATIPYPTVLALAVGLVTGVIASRYFALFLTHYLRNITPSTGKRGRLRFSAGVVLSASIPIAVCLVGAPLLLLDYDQGCTYYGTCSAEDMWTLIAPSFGPPSHVTPHLAVYLPIPTIAGSVVVAALLAFSRVCAFFTISSYRRQLREAEIHVRERVRLHAPAPMPPG